MRLFLCVCLGKGSVADVVVGIALHQRTCAQTSATTTTRPPSERQALVISRVVVVSECAYLPAFDTATQRIRTLLAD